MASINARSGSLQVDFRYKGQRCREQTRYADTPANRKKLEKILERMEAEILLETFTYKNYFPKSTKAEFFDELERKVAAARGGQEGLQDEDPTLAEFTEVWLSEKRVEWRDSYIKSITGAINS